MNHKEVIIGQQTSPYKIQKLSQNWPHESHQQLMIVNLKRMNLKEWHFPPNRTGQSEEFIFHNVSCLR